MATGPTLRVTADTSIAQLKAFADNLEDGQRLKGKVDKKDGSVTLYVAKNAEAGFMSKLTGKAEKREAAFKSAMTLMLTPKIDLLGSTTPGDVSALFGGKVGSPSSQGLKAAADYMTTLEQGGLANQQGSESPELKELPLSARANLRDGAQAIGTLMAAHSQDIKAYDTQVDKMAKALSEGLGKDPMAKLYPKAILSDGAKLIEGIKAQILEHAGDQLGITGEEVAQSMAEDVFRKATDSFLGGSAVKGSTDVVIGGKTYERKEMLGNPGGFGTAYRYEAKDGSGSIAVKFQNNKDPNTVETFRQEIVAHKRAASSDHPNVLGFKGALRTETGGFAIASELATNGDVSDAIPKILQAVKDGKITPEAGLAVQLTLLKDMAQGLANMHESAEMSHLDFKPPNAFIDEDGFAKVADFGTAVMDQNVLLEKADAIDNPTWKDGGVLDAKEQINDIFKAKAEDKAKEFAATFFPKGLDANGKIDSELMKKEYGPKAERFVNDLARAYVRTEKQETLNSTTFNGMAYDMFALGVVAVGLLTGDDTLLPEQMQTGFLSDVGDMQADFIKKGVLLVGDHPGAGRPSTGNTHVDDLLNALTNPVGWRRPQNGEELMDMPAFHLAHVDASETRDLLKGILKGDDKMIAEAMEWFA